MPEVHMKPPDELRTELCSSDRLDAASAAQHSDYLTELQRYAEGLVSKPADWMPWNYRNTLERGVASGEAPG
jgi:hypothetical protein